MWQMLPRSLRRQLKSEGFCTTLGFGDGGEDDGCPDLRDPNVPEAGEEGWIEDVDDSSLIIPIEWTKDTYDAR
jgi:hypothetical protein